MKLIAVILNYRTPELTIDCLKSVEGELERQDFVVVVDNASGDGSADQIERTIWERGWYTWVDLIRAPANVGFAAGNNLAIGAHTADAYLLLNSDVVVRPGTISTLRNALHEYPKAGLVGPSFEHGVGAKPEAAAFRAPGPVDELVRSAQTGPVTRIRERLTMSPAGRNGTSPDWIGFACVLIRRAVIDEIGLLDGGYFMYYEDIDYCLRARAAGWEMRHIPDAVVLHYLGRSSAVSPHFGTLDRLPRYYYEARARYFARYYGRTGLWAANLFWSMGWCLSRTRQFFGRKQPHHRVGEARDIWINAMSPFRQPAALIEQMR